MASRAQRLVAELRGELAALHAVASSSRGSTRSVRARLAESVFLNAVTEFESFLEAVFYATVCRTIRPGSTAPVVRVRDEAVLRRVVMRGSESYVPWLPLGLATERASQFLVDGVPFSRLERRESVRERLRLAVLIRNAVAHKSDAARGRFQRTVGQSYRTPGDYLIALSGSGTVCDAFLYDLSRFGEALCVSDRRADLLLGPEDLFPTGKKVRAGHYRCDGCRTEIVVAPGGALACPTCDPPCRQCGAVSRTARFTAL